MRALWSECQDSVVFGITHLSVIRGICLLEGRGPLSSSWSTAPLQASSLCSQHSFHPINPTNVSVLSLSLFLSHLLPRCTSAPTASLPTLTWIDSECTWWHSTRSSPCYAAHYARTCSTTRSTCSSTLHTSTVWRLTVLISLLPQWVWSCMCFACDCTQSA